MGFTIWVSRFPAACCQIPQLASLVARGVRLGGDAAAFYEMMTAPASRILNRWFESEPLISTLATDAIVGAMVSSSRLNGL